MKILNQYIVLVVILVSVKLGLAQPTGGSPNLPSPNASNLGTYTDIPISYYTGTPDISIPIAGVSDGELSSAVSISYHPGNITPGTPASNVGKGWSLNAGGVITRIVQHRPDDSIKGFIWKKKFDFDDGQQRIQDLQNYDQEPDIFSFNVDGLTGKFYFDGHIVSINPGLPTARYENTLEAKTIPKSDIKIEPIFDDPVYYLMNQGELIHGSGKIIGFKIINTNGKVYYFGSYDGREAIEESIIESHKYEYNEDGDYVRDGSDVETQTLTNSWYLIKIEDHNQNNEINFYYEDEVFFYRTLANNELEYKNYRSDRSINEDSRNDTGVLKGEPASRNVTSTDYTPNSGFSTMRPYLGKYHNYRTNIVKGVRISRIETNLDKIEFIYNNDRYDLYTYSRYPSNGPKSLDTILVSSNDHNGSNPLGRNFICKKYAFEYEYYKDDKISAQVNNPFVANDKKTLFLKNIRHNSCDETVGNNPFEFEYHAPEVSGSDKFFPSRLNKAIDHFGYYNGADGTYDSDINNNTKEFNLPTTLVKIHDRKSNGTITRTAGNAAREPHETYTKYGVLTKVNYPTGGSAEYDYENHRYSIEIAEDVEQRIKLIGCNSVDRSCCAQYNRSAEYTFNTIEEIKHGHYILNISTRPATNFTQTDRPNEGCYGDHLRRAEIKLNIREKSTGQLVHIMSMNITGPNQYSERRYSIPAATYDPVSNTYTGGGLRPNVTYLFEVEIAGGPGEFMLYTSPRIVIDDNKLGCGLRIKSTKLSDGLEETKNDIIKNYTYNIGETEESSGVRLAFPQYGVGIDNYDFIQIKKGVTLYDTYSGDEPHTIPHDREIYFQRILFSDYSYMPLYGFDGVHIGYTEVKETSLPNNGISVFKYKAHQNIGNETKKDYPLLPHQINLENGQLTSQEIISKDGLKVSETNYSPWQYSLDNMEYSRKYMKLYDAFHMDIRNWDVNIIVGAQYNIANAYYQLEEVTTTVNGISNSTQYEYDMLNPHLSPKAVLKTNTDGTVVREEFYFAYEEIRDANLYSAFEERNLLNTPIRKETHVVKNGNKTHVSGSKTKFSLFNGFGFPVSTTTTTSSKLYPYINYIYTGNINDEDDLTRSWIPIDTMLRYNKNGKILESKRVGWDKMTYHYQNDLIAGSTFLNHTKTVSYYPQSRLIQSKTDIDGTRVDYEYDQFGRLTKSYGARNNVITDIEYLNSDLSVGKLAGVKTTTNYTPTPGSPVTSNSLVKYVDGLGRALSEIAINASTRGRDLLTIHHYDSLGREYKLTEAFEGNYNGDFTWGPVNTPQEKFVYTEFDNTPLNRVISATEKDWYPIRTEYLTNTSQDAVRDIENGGYYPAGTLAKLVNVNAEGNKTISFTDNFGQVILARKSNASETKRNDTYYQYDLLGRVAKIIPPGATVSDDNLIYSYKYDGRGNKIEVNVPGKAKEVFVFNEKGQTVASQNYQLRRQFKWFVNEFDAYGRVVVKGTINGNSTKPSPTNLYVTEVWGQTNYGTRGLETNKVLSSTIGIFDGFNLLPNNLTYNYEYDTYGRVSKTTKSNHLGGYTETQPTYDFAGNIIESTIIHQKDILSSAITVVNSMDLTRQGRVINKYQTINGHREHLSHTMYDSLGRVIKTRVGVNGKTKQLQTIDFSFDAAGHTTGINANPTPDDLFSIQIGYDNGLGVANANTYTDGKIGTVRWQHKGGNWQNYTYEYDYLGQLTEASYSEQNGNVNRGAYSCNYTYDERGNFLTVKRNGVYKTSSGYHSTVIDNLSYIYYGNNPNKLKRVNEAVMGLQASSSIGSGSSRRPGGTSRLGSASAGSIGSSVPAIELAQFKGYHPQSTSETYEYDGNGNVTYDPSRKIDISYNYFDLPFRVEPKGKNKTLEILYDASGNMLQKKVVENRNVVSKTDYMGTFFYRNGTQIMNTENGKVKNLSTVPVYDYQLNDHLGNTRVVFSDRNGDFIIDSSEVLQINNFYPYGMGMYGSWNDLNASVTGADKNHFLYNGMERFDDLDLDLDFTTFRTYDPSIGRWYQIDPKATILPNYTPYNSMGNNPISFNDPNGDLPIAMAFAIGMAIGQGVNAGIQTHKEGKGFLRGFVQSIAISGVSMAVTTGVGDVFGPVSNKIGHEMARALTHGLVGGGLSVLQGGSFKTGFASGSFSSLSGSITNTATSFGTRIASAGIYGGIGSLISGGNFFSGAVQGTIVQALNHEADRNPTEPGPIFDDQGNIVGYVVGSNQGPTQIAEDLNSNYSCELGCEILWQEIYEDNKTNFQHVTNGSGDPYDKNNGDYRTNPDLKPGDVLIIRGNQIVTSGYNVNSGFDPNINQNKVHWFWDVVGPGMYEVAQWTGQAWSPEQIDEYLNAVRRDNCHACGAAVLLRGPKY